ncbi:hypothetical protein [Methanoculleus sp. 7T]|nr:hypothetical protein [Methanoculleus sp. 7T]
MESRVREKLWTVVDITLGGTMLWSATKGSLRNSKSFKEAEF